MAIKLPGRQIRGSPHFSAVSACGHITGALEGILLHLLSLASSSESSSCPRGTSWDGIFPSPLRWSLWWMQLQRVPPNMGVQGASDSYPAVCCPQLKLEEDMGHLREEMAKTQKLQTREQQALAEWQAGAGAGQAGQERALAQVCLACRDKYRPTGSVSVASGCLTNATAWGLR